MPRGIVPTFADYLKRRGKPIQTEPAPLAQSEVVT